MTKESLRAAMKARRRQMAPAEAARKSGEILRRLTSTDFYQGASRVMAYCAAFGEVETQDLLLRMWAAGKTVYVPWCDTQRRQAYPVEIHSLAELRPGAYGILEPRPPVVQTEPEDLDLIFVPGLAFDRRGGRIGFGMGYYDRLLENTQAKKAALAYDFQVVADVFSKPHDVPMDWIITEKELIACE